MKLKSRDGFVPIQYTFLMPATDLNALHENGWKDDEIMENIQINMEMSASDAISSMKDEKVR